MNLYAAMHSFGIQVEAGVIRNHEAALVTWREGRLPTADPPASPVIYVTENKP